MTGLLLAGYDIAVIGGDARDVVLAEELAILGANIWLYGFSKLSEQICSSIQYDLPKHADVLILPLPGIQSDGSVFAVYTSEGVYLHQLEQLLVPGVLLLCGKIMEHHRQYIEAHGVQIMETIDLHELAIYNAIPTAEGALEFALRESSLTIHGSKALVTGFGRCAQPLARILKALGAEVTIVARKRESLADAHIQGFITFTFNELIDYVYQYHYIFNTVPSLVINKNVLEAVRRDVLIIDIASAPGGVDFKAADELKRKAHLLPGLPGRTAPVSAGKILAAIYPYYIKLHKKGKE